MECDGRIHDDAVAFPRDERGAALQVGNEWLALVVAVVAANAMHLCSASPVRLLLSGPLAFRTWRQAP
jgi:hypothetical protein